MTSQQRWLAAALVWFTVGMLLEPAVTAWWWVVVVLAGTFYMMFKAIRRTGQE